MSSWSQQWSSTAGDDLLGTATHFLSETISGPPHLIRRSARTALPLPLPHIPWLGQSNAGGKRFAGTNAGCSGRRGGSRSTLGLHPVAVSACQAEGSWLANEGKVPPGFARVTFQQRLVVQEQSACRKDCSRFAPAVAVCALAGMSLYSR